MNRLLPILPVAFLSAACVSPETTLLTPLSQEQLQGRYHDFSDRAELVILVFGDAGTGDQAQKTTAAAAHAICQRRACDFAVTLGDNVYPAGVDGLDDDDFVETFEDPFAAFGDFDFWLVLGNHDWAGNAQAQIDHTLESDRWLMPAQTYVVPGLPDWLTLVAVDTQSVVKDATHIEHHRQIASDALCTSSGWRIAFAHHPVRSSGVGATEEVRDFFGGIHQQCGVDLALAGHDHHQEHINTAAGYPQIVQGAFAKTRSITRAEDSFFAAVEEGFMVAEINAARMRFDFYDDDGQIIYQGVIRRTEK